MRKYKNWHMGSTMVVNYLYPEISPSNKFVKNGLSQGSGDCDKKTTQRELNCGVHWLCFRLVGSWLLAMRRLGGGGGGGGWQAEGGKTK